MKHFKKYLIAVSLLLLAVAVQSQQVDLEIKFNCTTNRYDIHLKVISQLPVFSSVDEIAFGSSGIGVVFPGATANATTGVWDSRLTSVNGGAWFTASRVNDYTFNGVSSDFVKFGTGGGNVPGSFSTPGIDIVLFSIASPTGACIPGVRLFNNWANTPACPQSVTSIVQLPAGSDPCSGQPGFAGSDHRSSIQITTTNFNDIEVYRANQNNTGTGCTDGFDFGDLTSLWGSASAGVISPDCDDNGIPDGTGGAVWAGNIVDAETTQKFSAQTNLANGDDIDNRSDEDGLTPPVVPLNLGFSYTFNVRLNSNETGKQVFYGLWFDWNSDGNFNNDNAAGNGPAFYSGSGMASSPVDLSVFVLTPLVAGSGPGQANLTSYKTRLIASDAAVTAGMFNGTFANGEIEDYQAPASILPVTFGSFTAEAKNCNMHIAFDYLSQQNNKEFRIEYSINGTNWKDLALLPNTGNTGNRSFSYVHSSPAAGVNYYRIKQVDMDGHYSYSKTVTAYSNCAGGLRIISYPNPVLATLTVVLPLNLGKTQLRVTDGAGKIVINTTTQVSFNKINTQLLVSGMYLLEVVNAEKVLYTTKFVKE